MAYTSIILDLGTVCRLTLNRPQLRNAMTPLMGDEIVDAVRIINDCGDARLVHVRGNGEAFSAGGDFTFIERGAADSPDENRITLVNFYRRFLSIRSLRVPSLAVIHGAAVGAGLGLALACDLRYAACDARLALNFTRIGLHPGLATSFLVPGLIGLDRAAELFFTGRFVNGEEAAELGLVTAAVPREQLEALVSERTEQILAAAPLAVAQVKETLSHGVEARLEEAMAREAAAQSIDFASDDLAEAIRAFRERRTPTFRRR
ncbi:MAG: enoyl-CoA hydratase/isomerase family protein [Candidatus Schekmanbacteria bacterium]|nr:enoyl-CoA hydratase/isomerase family protein [Candidatus Schekmanbacteria bacterium]